jgi:hypothetical protein
MFISIINRLISSLYIIIVLIFFKYNTIIIIIKKSISGFEPEYYTINNSVTIP